MRIEMKTVHFYLPDAKLYKTVIMLPMVVFSLPVICI